MNDIVANCEKLEGLNIVFCTELNLVKFEIPQKFKQLFIDESKQQLAFGKIVQEKSPKVVINVCESEFNKILIYNYFL